MERAGEGKKRKGRSKGERLAERKIEGRIDEEKNKPPPAKLANRIAVSFCRSLFSDCFNKLINFSIPDSPIILTRVSLILNEYCTKAATIYSVAVLVQIFNA